ncbi:unnamed protein product, partial [Ixodes hexagonus]
LKLSLLLLSKVLTNGLLSSALKTRIQKHAPEGTDISQRAFGIFLVRLRNVTERHVPGKLRTIKKKKRKPGESSLVPNCRRQNKIKKKRKGDPALFGARDGPHTMLQKSALSSHAVSAPDREKCMGARRDL